MRFQLLVAAALLVLSCMDARAVTTRGEPRRLVATGDELCLARTMWGEARGEGDAGMLAVADVVLNRAERDGKTICWEVSRPAQFDGYDPSSRPTAGVVDLARRAVRGEGRGSTAGAVYFVERHIRTRWESAKEVTRRLGGHVFLR